MTKAWPKPLLVALALAAVPPGCGPLPAGGTPSSPVTPLPRSAIPMPKPLNVQRLRVAVLELASKVRYQAKQAVVIAEERSEHCSKFKTHLPTLVREGTSKLGAWPWEGFEHTGEKTLRRAEALRHALPTLARCRPCEDPDSASSCRAAFDLIREAEGGPSWDEFELR